MRGQRMPLIGVAREGFPEARAAGAGYRQPARQIEVKPRLTEALRRYGEASTRAVQALIVMTGVFLMLAGALIVIAIIRMWSAAAPQDR
jgi:hypothetical protein